jgi:hypothetical protein
MKWKELVQGKKVETVSIPALGEGVAVQVRRLSVAEMLRIGKRPDDTRPQEMAVACLMDEEGNPLFADAAAVNECDWAVFQPLLDEMNRVNGLNVAKSEKK